MARVSDRDRVLRLLSETEGLSNNRIKTELDLPDERYATVREALLDDSLIEKYQCYGGGIRLTRKGEKESPSYDGVGSTIENETALYKPLIAFLEKEADEDGLEAVNGDVEEWLDYVFSRNAAVLKAFNDRMHTVQKQLAARREED
jgi:hypothetical protein